MIKAIQTRYAGYFFRSRLEARWAVFFDALKLKWQYEPEGFQLASGEMYLPDFCIQLRKGILWVEIKPPEGSAKKLSELVKEGSPAEWQAVVLNEIPDPRLTYEGHDTWWGGEGGWDTPHGFCICEDCGEAGFEYMHEYGRIGCGHFTYSDERLSAAFAKARAARFEHDQRETYLSV